jgi:aspartate aminotransferase-like enzyme
MSTEPPLRFKIASEKSEFEQIFRLNYLTFVEEIPQHPPNPERRLVDRFHHENTYMIALEGDRLIGMLAARDKRPFSLDEKLGNIDCYLPPGRKSFEIRLLSIDPKHRTGVVLQGLLKLVVGYGKARNYNLAVISGTVKQSRLYRHLGFAPFGPLIGTPEASYQPMYLTLESFESTAPSYVNVPADGRCEKGTLFFLTGPVSTRPEIQSAMGAPPVSHRSDQFREQFESIRQRLCKLVKARSVQILLGSGTLANDAIAAQLALDSAHGIILSNGEFGTRLFDHARRAGLAFDQVEVEWGSAFEQDKVHQAIDRFAPGWMWATACETSTGVLNDLEMLQDLCRSHGIKLCLDCISAIGTTPTDMSGIYLASCVSGKGLGAFPGLSMVFYNHALTIQPSRLPRYLDLGYYEAQGGIPFTHSSNLLASLSAALERYNSEQPFAEIAELSHWLRLRLRDLGYRILAPDEHASPAVVTLALPDNLHSKEVGDSLHAHGFLVGYQSDYLRQRNWIQICLMGHCSHAHLELLLQELQDVASKTPIH